MKRKRAQEHGIQHPSTVRRLLAEELDVEIGLRSFLEETIQARISWANKLQEALQSTTEEHKGDQDGFKFAAIDALKAMESPCEIILPADRHFSKPDFTIGVLPPEKDLPRTARPRGLVARGRPTPPALKLLFIRYADPEFAERSQIVANLACTDCQRTDFATLQGLVNHCRMGHNRSYATHEDCIRACAVPIVDPDKQEHTMANGIEVASGGVANLPSLRRLFAIAVGDGNQFLPVQPNQLMQELVPDPDYPPLADAPTCTVAPTDLGLHTQDSTPLSRTLGLHKESPALAQFLGRAPKRRCINVFEEDINVDIGDERTEVAAGEKAWKMSFGHGSNVGLAGDWKEQAVISPLSDYEVEAPVVRSSLERRPPSGSVPEGASRFHVKTRVVVADRSWWISPERRSTDHQDRSHQWMITVRSPSYTETLSTYLAHFTVASLGGPVAFSSFTGNKASRPPFFVRGTTNKPFLAQVTLYWAGGYSDQNPLLNAPTVIEHWVDTGPDKYDHVVLGEEQLVDVELDRKTSVLEDRESLDTVSWDDHGFYSKRSRAAEATTEAGEKSTAYVKRLRVLLPRYPMTLKDVVTRRPPVVPYQLAPTTTHLQNMVYGRRKAIEFARARAISDAYNKQREVDGGKTDLPHMSTSAVFRWLEADGLFARPATLAPLSLDAAKTVDPRLPQDAGPDSNNPPRICAYCGLNPREHPLPVIKQEDAESTPQCPLNESGAPLSLPTLDACTLFDGPSIPAPASAHRLASLAMLPHQASSARTSRCAAVKDLLAAADPRLVIAIGDAWNALGFNTNLPSGARRGLHDCMPASLPTVGPAICAYDAEQRAAQAVLALALRPFVRRLVTVGVTELRQQPAGFLGVRTDTSPSGPRRFVLTPHHVLRGVLSGAEGSLVGSAMFVALADLKISARFGDGETEDPIRARS